MELKILKSILKDLKLAYGSQYWAKYNFKDLGEEYQRREDKINALKEMIKEVEEKASQPIALDGNFIPLSKITVTANIELNLHRKRMYWPVTKKETIEYEYI